MPGTDGRYSVPPPVPPDDPAAWYASGVHAQYEVHPGVVVTVSEREGGFAYRACEPGLTEEERAARDRVREYLAGTGFDRPRTRQGARERVATGLAGKYGHLLDRLTDLSPAARRRVAYHVLADCRCLGRLTPHALDDSIEVADTDGDRLVVHTTDYSPAVTTVEASAHLERFASERVQRYGVDFLGYTVPVVQYRERLLGGDPFTHKYAVLEPELLPGDEALVTECKERLWEGGVDELVDDRAAFVRRRAETLLARRLAARDTRAWLDGLRRRVRAGLSAAGLAAPPVDDPYTGDRLDDLVYYVLRDFVGHGQLTIPLRDPNLEDVEANRVGERVKVVPRGEQRRIPTNLVFDDEATFGNVVTQLAADDGVELSASTPSAKVNVDAGTGETIRCAVALPVVSEDGPHISIRKQAAEPMTPVDLIEQGALSTELVALLWLLYEHRCVVLFSGPTGVGKTTLLNAHVPFVSYDDRPVSIDEGSREVRIPHETGISLTTRDHEDDHKQVSMADLMTAANYLNPDLEIIAEINTPASFETFAETLQTGHGVLGTTHAEDVETLVNRVIEQGLPAYLLREIDLVVFPRHVDGERYVGEAIELLTESAYRQLDRADDASGTVRKDGTTIYWNRVAERTRGGDHRVAFDHPQLGDADRALHHRVFHAVGRRTDRSVEAVEREFLRKHGYVEYLVRAGYTDFEETFELLADLQNDETATVERIRRDRAADGTGNDRPDLPDRGVADGDD